MLNKMMLPFAKKALSEQIASKISSIEDLSDVNHFLPDSHFIYRVRIHFKNKTQLSIIRGEFTYGGDQGLFEIAPYNKEGKMDGSLLNIQGDDVIGYLSVEEVNKYIEKMANLK